MIIANDPTKQPFTCPVCNGHGTVSRPPHIAGDQLTWADSSTRTYECQACNGSGIVWADTEQTEAR
jgi:DnaJ-class molecular chaperone